MKILFLILILVTGCSSLEVKKPIEILPPKFNEIDDQFYVALRINDEDKINLLINEVNFNAIGYFDSTMTHGAVNSSFKLFEKIIKEKNPPIDNKDIFGETPLRLAVRSGKIEHVKLLLEKGANINNIDPYGNPIFFEALRNKNLSLLKVLLKYNFDPNVIGFLGKTWKDYDFATEIMTDYVKTYRSKNK